MVYYLENGEVFLGSFREDEKHDKEGIVMTASHVTRGAHTPVPMDGPYERHSLQCPQYFKGTLEKGEKCHKGEWRREQCFYSGLFQSDTYHGNGKLESEEEEYEGQFVSGRYDGYGLLKVKTTGCSYMGEFANGLIEGKGQYTYANKDIFNGWFIKGSRQGKGVIWNHNSEIYEGFWVDDHLVGTLKYTDSQQNLYSGYVVNGVFDLEKSILVKFNSGVSYEGVYDNMPPEMQQSTAHVFRERVSEMSGGG